MHPAQHLVAILERLLYLARLRKCALEHFQRVPNTKLRVRRSEVSKVVAEKLDLQMSPAFGADVVEAMRGAGWKFVRVDNVASWLGVVRLQ